MKNYLSQSGKTIEEMLTALSGGINFHEAATGTIYATFGDKSVRIADHEPNFGNPTNSHDYREFYTKTADNTIIPVESVIEQIAEYFEIEITGELADDMAAFYKFQDEIRRAAYVHVQEMAALQEAHNAKLVEIEQLIGGRHEEVRELINEANAQSDAIVKGDKRRKRRRAIFKTLFLSKFGQEVELSDVAELLKTK